MQQRKSLCGKDYRNLKESEGKLEHVIGLIIMAIGRSIFTMYDGWAAMLLWEIYMWNRSASGRAWAFVKACMDDSGFRLSS